MKKICKNCDTEFEDNTRGNIKLYCSLKCSHSFKLRQKRKEKQQIRDKIERDFLRKFGIMENVVSFPIKK